MSSTALMALAGLLHQIGQLATRAQLADANTAQFVRSYVPNAWHSSLNAMLEPDSTTDAANMVRSASRLAWGAWPHAVGAQAQAQTVVSSTDSHLALNCIFDDVRLGNLGSDARPRSGYRAVPLSLDEAVIFPQSNASNTPEDYAVLWQGLCADAAQLTQLADLEAYVLSLQSLLRRYTSFVPASGPAQAQPSAATVSFYDHARVTAAIAACLQAQANAQPNTVAVQTLIQGQASAKTPVAVLCRGGLNRIQSYIFRVTRSEDDKSFEKVAKALRGRSFYVGLLSELIARWVLRALGLPITHLLFVGGGRFDLLLPNIPAVIQQLQTFQAQIDQWMLDEFEGELGARLVTTTLTVGDCQDLSAALTRLDAELERSKLTKWQAQLNEAQFFTPGPPVYEACKMTGLPLKPDEKGLSKQCRDQIEIGKSLPYTDKIAIVWDTNPPLPASHTLECEVGFEKAPFAARVWLLSAQTDLATLLPHTIEPSQVELRLIRRTDIAQHASARYGVGFQFLANTVPIAKTRINHPDDIIDQGDVVHFGQIGSMSDGSALIGILKADVDHLGLIFGMGLAQDNQRPTLARVSTMSSLLDIFFCGWLDEICHALHFAGRGSAEVSQRFYVLYSGGDDLFIVGPWNDILGLAQRLRNDFRRYVNANPAVTVSAGVVMVKPHFPVQRFAELAEAELKRAKHAGRNRITAFDCVLPWDGFATSFDFAKEMHQLVAANDMPRGLLHDLGQVYRQHFGRFAQAESKPMWTPRLYYTITRRLKPDIRRKIEGKVFEHIQQGKILFPVSYVSLMTR